MNTCTSKTPINKLNNSTVGSHHQVKAGEYDALLKHLKHIIQDPRLTTEVKHSIVFERGLADSITKAGMLSLPLVTTTASNKTELEYFLTQCETKLKYLQSIGVNL